MKIFKYFIQVLLIFSSSYAIAQRPFTAGNIVVYRVGNGTTPLTTAAAPVFLDEYTPTGTLVQSIPMPTVASASNNILTARGLGGGRFEGMINLSINGKYLIVPGMNAAPGGTASTASVIGVVDFNGKVNTATAVTDFVENSNIPYSAISDDGSRFWFGGFGAIRYATAGSSSSVLVVSNSATHYDFSIADGQLYTASNLVPPSIYKVGNGLPATTGQSLNTLPGLSLSLNPIGFEFADLDPNVAGVDVLYIADQGTPGGILKYSLVNNAWVSNGNVGTSADSYSNLEIKLTGTSVTIFAVRRGSNSNGVRGGELVTLTDNSGYNGTLSGTPAVIASIATPNTSAFRGVALVPQPAPFTPGNFLVYRVGDGSASLTTAATPVFLDEYTLNGTVVQSIAMPTSSGAGNNILTARGLGGGRTEGMINLSSDGKSLIVPGINTAPGSTGSTAAVIGVVDFNAKINTTTAITDFTENANIPFSAISDDGKNLWFGAFGAIRYATVGSSTSILINNNGSATNDFSIANGQLYVANTLSPPSIYRVGTGLPTTSGQSLTALPGLPLSLTPMQFEFADLDPNVAGADVLYIADQGTPGGVLKFSLVGGTWVSNGNVGTAADSYSNLTLRISNNVVTIIAVRRGTNSNGIRGGEIVEIIDNSGYNGALTASASVIATVPVPNTSAFRGVSRVPIGCPPVAGLRVPDISSSQANIYWNSGASGTNYEYAVTTSAVPPASGAFTANNFINVSSLQNATTYYVHVRTACSASSVSEWNTLSFTTGCKAPVQPNVSIKISPTGVTEIKWNKVFGAASYEYFVSTSVVPPSSGTSTSDTSFTISNLNSVTQYYVHVRSNCGGGATSAWTTKSLATGCFVPSPNIQVMAKTAGVSWNRVTNAVRYEYALTYGADKPLSGNTTTDTFYLSGKVSEATSYYFHVRSICSNGSVSAWTTIHFNTIGLQVYPNPVKDVLNIQLNGFNNSSGEIIIGDATGRIISRMRLNNSTTTVNTRGWAPGIYLVRYDDGKNKYSVRIVKQ